MAYKQSSGIVTNPGQPAFFAYLSSTQGSVTGNGTNYTVPYDVAPLNQGNYFNTGTGVFTAPVTGLYGFSPTVYCQNLTVLHTTGAIFFTVNGGTFWLIQDNNVGTCADATGSFTYNSTFNINLTAADTVSIIVTIYNSGQTINIGGAASASGTTFSGFLIC